MRQPLVWNTQTNSFDSVRDVPLKGILNFESHCCYLLYSDVRKCGTPAGNHLLTRQFVEPQHHALFGFAHIFDEHLKSGPVAPVDCILCRMKHALDSLVETVECPDRLLVHS